MEGTFSIIVNLANAAFTSSNPQTELPYNNTLIVTYVLQGLKETSTNLYFVVDPNAITFAVSIGLKSSQLLPAFRYIWNVWSSSNPIFYDFG